MKERLDRLRTIKDIIQTTKIESQERLLKHLGNRGYCVTQATLSRDLKFLKVGKIPDKEHGQIYRLPEAEAVKESEEGFIEDIERGTISLSFSGNIGVLHTMPGHANSVAFALDNFEFDEILGTIAGDDTVLLVLREGLERESFLSALVEKIPYLELSE
mgnify:CR=1 FL=1|jgi:transcriptional regulator of arginine metabolism